ncbi:MAG: hypothetical protein R3183_02115 [Oleiphilaceae bacterium]|nr:hypothetical protein [Oleiphilaceae bacterium]
MGMVIAVLLTLALAGSVLWVMPSPKERRITAMRNAALKNGLRVRLLDASMAKGYFSWLADHRGYVLYELPRLGGTASAGIRPRVIRLRRPENEHELDRDAACEAYVAQRDLIKRLPTCSEALLFQPASVAVLWQESKESDESVVEEIARVLKECLDHPPGE